MKESAFIEHLESKIRVIDTPFDVASYIHIYIVNTSYSIKYIVNTLDSVMPMNCIKIGMNCVRIGDSNVRACIYAYVYTCVSVCVYEVRRKS